MGMLESVVKCRGCVSDSAGFGWVRVVLGYRTE